MRKKLPTAGGKSRAASSTAAPQHFVSAYGDDFLRVIQQQSEKLKLALDGSAVVEPNANRKIYTVPKQHQSNLTAAKFEVWKMWQEDGLSAEKIANYPGRSAPIKETTVHAHLLDAALVGYELDLPRLCKELKLTQEIFANIEAAILKVGSKEKLKPIKDELPEEARLSDMMKHFNGSTESVFGLVTSLASEFLIFKKKNDVYKLL